MSLSPSRKPAGRHAGVGVVQLDPQGAAVGAARAARPAGRAAPAGRRAGAAPCGRSSRARGGAACPRARSRPPRGARPRARRSAACALGSDSSTEVSRTNVRRSVVTWTPPDRARTPATLAGQVPGPGPRQGRDPALPATLGLRHVGLPDELAGSGSVIFDATPRPGRSRRNTPHRTGEQPDSSRGPCRADSISRGPARSTTARSPLSMQAAPEAKSSASWAFDLMVMSVGAVLGGRCRGRALPASESVDGVWFAACAAVRPADRAALAVPVAAVPARRGHRGRLRVRRARRARGAARRPAAAR